MAEADDPGRQRLPAAERRRALVDAAAAAFAEAGFALSTRDLAARCRVTQALFYKYFKSKDDLVDAVLEARFLAGREPPDAGTLRGTGRLADRIGDFYGDFVARGSAVNVRLFLRAALDGLDLPLRYGARLDARMLGPVLDALRAEIGHGPGPVPLPPDQRELAMMLHGAAVFALIRREVYGAAFHVAPEDLVRMHVRVWVPGALDELRRILEKSGDRTTEEDR